MGQPAGDFSETVTGMVMEDDHLRQYQQLLFREMNGGIITLYRGWTRHYLSGDVSEVLRIMGLTQKETDGDFDAMAQSANMGSLHYWLDCG